MTILADNVIPLGNYPADTYQVGFGQGANGPLVVPNSTTSCDISIQRCTTATPTIWPNVSTTIILVPEVSLDGGITWIEAGRSTSAGGIAIKKDGITEEAWTRAGGGLPAGTNRLWRCSITVNETIRTSVRVEVD